MFYCLRNLIVFPKPSTNVLELLMFGKQSLRRNGCLPNCNKKGNSKFNCGGRPTNVTRISIIYESVFGKYLWLTNTISTAVLMSAGDLIQQYIEYVNLENHAESFDWIRNRNMAIVGFLLGPLTHWFYSFLDYKYPGRALKVVAWKVFWDTTISSPFFIVFFFLVLNLVSRVSFKDSLNELRSKFLDVYYMECCVWIPCQFINFLFISNRFRVIYLSCVSLCHNVILSYLKYTK